MRFGGAGVPLEPSPATAHNVRVDFYLSEPYHAIDGGDVDPDTGRPQVVVVVPAGDGLPLERGGLWYSFHLGLNSPFGSFSKSYDPGPSLTVDAEYQIAKSFSLVAMYGLHVFDGNLDGLYYHSFLLDACVDVPLTWTRLYAQAGPGIYLPNAGSNVFGLNLGLGLTFPVLPKLKIEIGPDFHLLDPGGLRRWFLDAKLGVAFRL